MSPHAPDTSKDSDDVVFADEAEQFTTKPLINDLLRTRYCVPGSIFLVEDVESIPVARSRRWRTVRLLLGDGDFCMQALLRGEMHRFLDTGDVKVGCYVRLGQFSMRFRDVADGGGGGGGTGEVRKKMVYLIVDDLVTVGWHRAFTDPDAIPQGPLHTAEDDFISGSDLEIADMKPQQLPQNKQKPAPRKVAREGKPMDDNDDEAFEVMKVSETKATQRRFQAKNLAAPVALPRDWTDPSIPLKLTPLKSIPNLPYKQNWSVNILAVITSLSHVEPSHMPPHTQRTARLADPSTGKQVILTVFFDAEEFRPSVGSVVLLVGVKNHRFDGGCLKKYVSDRPRPGSRWWFEEPREFDWCDVDGLKAWWEQHQRKGSSADGQ